MARPLIGITTQRRDSDQGQMRFLGLLDPYVDAVRHQGGLPIMMPLGLTVEELRELYGHLDGLIISGGGDVDPKLYNSEITSAVQGMDRDRDRIEVSLTHWAVEDRKPLLAICRGIQLLNVAMGGTLWRDIATEVPTAAKHDHRDVARHKSVHPVVVESESLLAQVLGKAETEVNSLHHQSCKDIAPGARAVASAPDGVVEGVEIVDHPFAIGVQWHPEWMQDAPAQQGLFSALVSASRSGR